MTARFVLIAALGAVLGLAAMPAEADPIDYTPGFWNTYRYTESGTESRQEGDVWWWSHEDDSWYEEDHTLSSRVEFEVVEGNLQVTLSNVGDPTNRLDHVLQGVFFNASGIGDPAGPGALGPYGPGDPDTNSGWDGAWWVPSVYTEGPGKPIGGRVDEDGNWVSDYLNTWGYRHDLNDEDNNPFNQAYGVTHGIGNPGLENTFGPDSTFGTLLDEFDEDYWPEHPPYGIVAPDTEQFNPTVLEPFIENSLRFTFELDDNNFNPADITDVYFQYSTDINIIPEPATLSLLGLGLAGMGVRRLTRRNKKR